MTLLEQAKEWLMENAWHEGDSPEEEQADLKAMLESEIPEWLEAFAESVMPKWTIINDNNTDEPEDAGDYLLSGWAGMDDEVYPAVDMGHYTGNEWYTNLRGIGAWMPLPAPHRDIPTEKVSQSTEGGE